MKFDESYPREPRRLVRAWIWFWYNNVTRFCMLFGLHLLAAMPWLARQDWSADTRRLAIYVIYLGPLLWAMLDNNYSNLRRIGLDENRRLLPKELAS